MGKATWQPKWWTPETHESGWDRIKAAMQRDWEQTKSDLGVKGARDLHQDVGDTVAQAAGNEPIPAGPNPPSGRGDDLQVGRGDRSWDQAETGLRYGYGARQQYGAQFQGWNEDLEKTLKNDWESAGDKTGQGWDDAKRDVRWAYERGR